MLLTAVANGGTLGIIRGHITGTEAAGGVLVTAAGATDPTGLSGVSASDGTFAIFNVPAATYSVRGYAAGLQLTPVPGVVVAVMATVENVDLAKNDTATSTLSGSVNAVAGGCTQGTSVTLVPRETLMPGTIFPLTAISRIRAEVPRGLRAPQAGQPAVSNNYTITGIPDGTYAVLAAYENDADPCVFDPSSIGGAFFVPEISAPATGGVRTLTVDAFKITGAVLITGPGAGDTAEPVDTLTPTFGWQEYSSAKNYQVAVYDSAGRQVWLTTVCPDAANGCTNTTQVTYGTAGAGTTQPTVAPVLAAKSLYQWRVIALGSNNGGQCGFDGAQLADRECISLSEDLRGVFVTP